MALGQPLNPAVRQLHNRRRSMKSPEQNPAPLISIDLSNLSRTSLLPSRWVLPTLPSASFLILITSWYLSSVIASNSDKWLMDVYPHPVTMSYCQFLFASLYAYIAAKILGVSLQCKRRWSIACVVAPQCFFMVLGHVLTSVATQRIPVSLVHTIKALSPLFTVMTYQVLFNVQYSLKIYRALLMLTVGVVLTLNKSASVQMDGVLCALGACVVYVAQTIFSKRILTGKEQRMSKLELFFWSAVAAVAALTPIWLCAEGPKALAVPSPLVLWHIWINGSFQALQAFLGLTVLAVSAPASFSVASLIKRIVVIVTLVVASAQPATEKTRLLGLGLAVAGLWMYSNAQETQKTQRTVREIILPFSTKDL